MNAYELANELDKLDTKIMIKGLEPNDLFSAELCDQAAITLRQQQAEIEFLQKNLDVALMIVNEPAKTLTDEEIIKTMVQFDVYSADDQCLIEAGKAILKKASEK